MVGDNSAEYSNDFRSSIIGFKVCIQYIDGSLKKAIKKISKTQQRL